MHQKQKTPVFDIVAFIIFLALAFVFWSFMRAISLVQPDDLKFETSDHVEAAGIEPEVESQTTKDKIKDEFDSELEKAIDDFVSSQPNQFAIYVEHLDSGVFAEHNGQLAMTMASLYKPFVTVEALKLIDSGQLNSSQIVNESGDTLMECLGKTITVSDNPCGRALLRITNLGGDFGRKKLAALGYDDTDLRGFYPETTPRDVAELFKNIYEGVDLSMSGKEHMLDLLIDQKINDRLPTGLPGGVKIAHKTGDLNGYVHDAGIVISGQSGDYVIAVMSGPDDSGRMLAQRYADFGRIAQSVHKLMQRFSSRLEALSS